MINSATGFRRTDLAKIALARSFGASTLQIFTKIRFPLALPMIIVGLMVGAIFGLLTAVGAEMVGGTNGLGNQLWFYSSLIQMPQIFWAIILILATDGHLDLRHLLLDRQEVGQLASVKVEPRTPHGTHLTEPDFEGGCFLTLAACLGTGIDRRSGIDGAGFAPHPDEED